MIVFNKISNFILIFKFLIMILNKIKKLGNFACGTQLLRGRDIDPTILEEGGWGEKIKLK